MQLHGKAVEHVRMVNFAIVAASSALIIAMSSSPLETAQADLGLIHNLFYRFEGHSRKHLDVGPALLELLAQQHLPPEQQLQERQPQLAVDLHLQAGESSIPVSVLPPLAIIFDGPSEAFDGTPGTDCGYSDFPGNLRPEWHNLSTSESTTADPNIIQLKHGPWELHSEAPRDMWEFIDLWNTLYRMRHSYTLESAHYTRAYRVAQQPAPAPRPISSRIPPLHKLTGVANSGLHLIPIGSTATPARRTSDPDNVTYLDARAFTLLDLWTKVGRDNLYRPLMAAIRLRDQSIKQVFDLQTLQPGDIVLEGGAEYIHRPIDIQKQLLVESGAPKSRRGSFSTTFPNLHAVLPDRKTSPTLTLNLTEWLLDWGHSQDAAAVEVGPIKLRQGRLSVWGAATILVLQAYFALHALELLRRLRRAEKPELPPWLPLYRGWPSMIMATASFSVLPTIAVSVSLFTRPDNLVLHSLFLAISAMLSIVATVVMCHSRASLGVET